MVEEKDLAEGAGSQARDGGEVWLRRGNKLGKGFG